MIKVYSCHKLMPRTWKVFTQSTYEKNVQFQNITTSKPDTYDKGSQLPPTNAPTLADCCNIRSWYWTVNRLNLAQTTRWFVKNAYACAPPSIEIIYIVGEQNTLITIKFSALVFAS